MGSVGNDSSASVVNFWCGTGARGKSLAYRPGVFFRRCQRFRQQSKASKGPSRQASPPAPIVGRYGFTRQLAAPDTSDPRKMRWPRYPHVCCSGFLSVRPSILGTDTCEGLWSE